MNDPRTGTTLPAWHGRRAPTGLPTYDAWQSAPVSREIAESLYGERPPRSYVGLVLFMVGAGAAIMWLAWWLR